MLRPQGICKTVFRGAKNRGQTRGAQKPGQTRGAKNPGQTRGAKNPGQACGAKNPGQTWGAKSLAKCPLVFCSKKKPSISQFNNLIFAFNVCRHVKSNAIVLATNKSTIGIGSGQPSRLDSCEIAINKMCKFNDKEAEIVAASDAFFPFVDGIEKLVQSGISAIIQPSGSVKDKEIIKFANRTKTILVFSKTRHFKH